MDWLLTIPDFPDVSGVIVVDGGGTRSRAALADPSGRLLSYVEGGPTNSRSAGDDRAADNVEALIRDCIEVSSGDGDATAVLVSSASVDTAAHAEVLAEGVRRAVPASTTISVVADTIGCWAATAQLRPAVAVIAGTGSAVLAGSLAAGSQRFGGWDYVLGDEGSGYALGRAALRETLFVAEGRSDAEALADACRAELGITDTDELFDLIYKPEVDKSVIASYATQLLDLAAEGDPSCLALATDQASLLADTVAAGVRRYDDLHTVGCFGGLWNVELYRSLFADALGRTLDPTPEVVFPGDTAMAGSYRLVLRYGRSGAAGADEDAAVERFTDALVAAKDDG